MFGGGDVSRVFRFLAIPLIISTVIQVTASSASPVALVGTGLINRRPPSYFDVWAKLFDELEIIHAAPDIVPQKLLALAGLGGSLDMVFDNVANLRRYAGQNLLHVLGTVDQVIAELGVERENLVIVDGHVVGLQIRQDSRWFPLNEAEHRWGMAWIRGSEFDDDARRIFMMAADLLKDIPIPDDQGFEVIWVFMEYLLRFRDVESAIHYIHPSYLGDYQISQRYRNRLHAFAFTEQFAERGVLFFRPYHPEIDQGIDHLVTWHNPITNETYQDITRWPVEIISFGGIRYVRTVNIVRHDGKWYIVDF